MQLHQTPDVLINTFCRNIIQTVGTQLVLRYVVEAQRSQWSTRCFLA